MSEVSFVLEGTLSAGQIGGGGSDTLAEALSSSGLESYENDDLTVIRKPIVKKYGCPNATEIAEKAFYYDTSIEEVDAENVTIVGENAFMGASNLKKVSFGNISSIGAGAFMEAGVSENNEIDVVVSATSIPGNIFKNAKARNVSLTEYTGEINSGFFRGGTFTNISLPKATALGNNGLMMTVFREGGSFSAPEVTQVSQNGFGQTTVPFKVTLPKCQEVGQSGFARSDIAALELGDLRSIGNSAFYATHNLLDLYLPGSEVPTVTSGAFTDSALLTNENGKIHVPANKLTDYQNDAFFGTYSTHLVGDLPNV